MFDINDPSSVWLNVTNFVLGIVTVICCAIVGKAVYADLRARFGRRKRMAADDHAFVIPQLGITMADGGKKLQGDFKDRGNGSSAPQDEENIFRSEN